MLVNRLADFGNILFSVDDGPNKTSHFVKVNVADFRLFKKLLSYAVKQSLVFDFKGYDALFVDGFS